MRNWILALFIALPLGAQNNNAAPPKPKLVVAIVIDQFRYDYLTRFHSEYSSNTARYSPTRISSTSRLLPLLATQLS